MAALDVQLSDDAGHVCGQLDTRACAVDDRDRIFLRDHLTLVDDELLDTPLGSGSQLVHVEDCIDCSPRPTHYVVPVVLYLGTIVLAAFVVVVTKGSFRRLGQIELRALWLLFLALAIQIALEFVTFPKARIDDVGFGLLMLSFALILAFCIMNLRTSGFLVIAVGVGLNMLVIGLNQGMPTKDDVRERDGRTVHVPIERTVKHRPQENDDLLVFLSDQLSVPGVPNESYSIGDVVIALGIIDVCFEASRRPRRRGVYTDRAEATS